MRFVKSNDGRNAQRVNLGLIVSYEPYVNVSDGLFQIIFIKPDGRTIIWGYDSEQELLNELIHLDVLLRI